MLTVKERQTIDEHFKGDKYFRRFLHIFFHSGARVVELLSQDRKEHGVSPEEFKNFVNLLILRT